MAEDALILVMIAALIAGCCSNYLYLRFRHRLRNDPPESHWPGRGIDASQITNQVRRVRRDYVAALLLRLHGTGRRMGLLESVKRVVTGLPYFQRHPSRRAPSPERETENHAA